jgi:UDP-N-acetylmuramoyl-tripeptide--D-alanyl-D-alanine ligase
VEPLVKARYAAADVARWTGGFCVAGPPGAQMQGASIDSRTLKSGELFVAIVGPTHDGHDHLAGAIKAGAAGLLVECDRELPDQLPDELAVVEVPDTTSALGALGRGHRARFDGPVVAITGSNGKTTTKEMCAGILSVRGPCHRTPGNLNNQFGLPLTLLGRDVDDHAMVVELGMNHRGEIAELVAVAQPTVGLITNVGTAHIEYLGSREEIAREKGDIVAGLHPHATAVLNADDPLVMQQAARCEARVVTFGVNEDADVRVLGANARAGGGYTFRLSTPDGAVEAEILSLGSTALINAAAAAAGAWATGATPEEIRQGLATHEPVKGRLQPRQLGDDRVLIDDTYNANPQSTEAALRVLADLRGDHRAIAVLADMGELGAAADDAHRDAGQMAAKLGIDHLIALGTRAETIAGAAIEAGMDRENVAVATDHADAGARASAWLAAGDTVLVKGSRSMQMERVVEVICAEKGTE